MVYFPQVSSTTIACGGWVLLCNDVCAHACYSLDTACYIIIQYHIMPAYRWCNILHIVLGMYLHSCPTQLPAWYGCIVHVGGVVGVGLPMSNCIVYVHICDSSGTNLYLLWDMRTHGVCTVLVLFSLLHSGTCALVLQHTTLLSLYTYLPGECVRLVHVNLCIYPYNMLWSVTVEQNSDLVWVML